MTALSHYHRDGGLFTAPPAFPSPTCSWFFYDPRNPPNRDDLEGTPKPTASEIPAMVANANPCRACPHEPCRKGTLTRLTCPTPLRPFRSAPRTGGRRHRLPLSSSLSRQRESMRLGRHPSSCIVELSGKNRRSQPHSRVVDHPRVAVRTATDVRGVSYCNPPFRTVQNSTVR